MNYNSIRKLNLRLRSFEGQVELPRNSAFEFRYLRDNALWQIETQADKYVYNKFADGENSVVITK